MARKRLHASAWAYPDLWKSFNESMGIFKAGEKYPDSKIQQVAKHFDASLKDLKYMEVNAFDALYWEYLYAKTNHGLKKKFWGGLTEGERIKLWLQREKEALLMAGLVPSY